MKMLVSSLLLVNVLHAEPGREQVHHEGLVL
jgi:hypothetical protein